MVKVTVNINGKEYSLKGKNDSQYLIDIAEYVDSKINEIKAKNSMLSYTDMAVLAAINIADELYSTDSTAGDLAKKNKSLEEKNDLLDSKLNKITEEHERLKKEKDNLSSKIEAKYDIKISNLIKENKELEATLVSEKENSARNNKSKIDKLEEENKKLKEENNKVSNEYIEIGEKHSEVLSRNQELEQTVNEIQNINDMLNKEIMTVSAEDDELKEENGKLQRSLREFKENVKDKIKEGGNGSGRELTSAKYKVMDLEKKLIEVQIELAKMKKNNNPLVR